MNKHAYEHDKINEERICAHCGDNSLLVSFIS